MAKSGGAGPKVSVIVPHYHDLIRLGLCLDALERQTYPRENFEIVVADNASPEGLDAVEKVARGRARVVVVEARGAAAARNGGIDAAAADILAFTDCDCIPDADWLAAGLGALEGCDLVGGRVRVLVSDEQRLTGEEAFERVFAFDNRRYVEKLGFTVTANLFSRRDVFEAVGGFRTGISEDLEWCRRAVDAGHKLIYAEAAAVGHPARRDWAELTAKWRRINRETFGLDADKRGARLRWLIRSLLLPVSALAHTPRALRSAEVEGLGKRVAAVGVLHRHRWWRLGDALRILFEARP